jgi:hypothetical protein
MDYTLITTIAACMLDYAPTYDRVTVSQDEDGLHLQPCNLWVPADGSDVRSQPDD